ncbi:uncharacterized protein LOC111070317 [Drosophila obscura]|uniref:uncharacterized protein LOC111070317 n=1 Tax=Drosophila obscura TaxID=7282 RepID=UPI000B9FB054|nr:uncharacterized protein LOC111070317 [Drosophila obscura]
MCAKVFCLLLLIFASQALLGGSDAKRFFGVGQRIEGDQLLLKDVQHSRPAGISEQPRVIFNYEIPEPITYIEIVSEENIYAEVKFSYTDHLVVGMISVLGTNQSHEESQPQPLPLPTPAFDVTILIFGFNHTVLNVNPSLLINRDRQFEGELQPFEDYDAEEDDGEFGQASKEFTELYDNIKRDALEVDIEEEDLETETETEGPGSGSSLEFDNIDKVIEIGHRQPGDQLVYETFQTSPNESSVETNHTVVFYYVDSDSITYVKFVIFGHYSDRSGLDPNYVAPVAEYSHYSSGTLKAVITDFSTVSLFVQMFVYGYRAQEAPQTYEPFLPPPHWQRPTDEPPLTPMQRMQLLMMTGKVTTAAAPPNMSDDEEEEEEDSRKMRPEDMLYTRTRAKDQTDVQTDDDKTNAALPQLDRGSWALMWLLLLILQQHQQQQ